MNKEEVLKALSFVTDAVSKKDIMAAELVKDVVIDGNNLSVCQQLFEHILYTFITLYPKKAPF